MKLLKKYFKLVDCYKPPEKSQMNFFFFYFAFTNFTFHVSFFLV